LPDPVKNLFAVAELKLAATAIGIRKLELGERGGRVQFVPKPKIDPMTIIRMIQGQPRVFQMDGPDRLRLKMELPGATERLATARSLLESLVKS